MFPSAQNTQQKKMMTDVDPMICHGEPVVRGTRVPVRIIIGSLAGGMTPEEIRREYDISAEDIQAAARFGAPTTNN
jgi:uncharacterized protein (DUF433 family)